MTGQNITRQSTSPPLEKPAVGDYSHDSFGKQIIKMPLRADPVRLRHDLVCILLGAPGLAPQQQIPDSSEIVGDAFRQNMMTNFSWATRRQMVIDHICDFLHAILECKHRSLTDAMPTRYEGDENRAYPACGSFVTGGQAAFLIKNRQRVNVQAMKWQEHLAAAEASRVER